MVAKAIAATRDNNLHSTISARSAELLVDLALIIGSAALFSFAFPSLVSDWGWFPLAYIALVPLFVVVRRSRWSTVWLYGALYGFVTYSLFNYWLLNFHPLAIFLVPVIYAVYFLLLFPLLKLADTLFPRYGYLVQIAIWIAYEYLRLQGFLGYAYGILGYSQYLFSPLVRLSALTGVWGVSLLVAFPSAFVAAGLKEGPRRFGAFLRGHRLDAFVYVAAFILALGYGFASRVDYSESRSWRVAMVQQNIDPWRGGLDAYRESLDSLIRQSNEALAQNPEAVVWSETSFVPAIGFHTRYRTDPQVYELVDELRAYLGLQAIPFVIGNSDAVLSRTLDGELERVDHNAVLLHHNGEFRRVYRKLHLVPFTEHFPYERSFPRLHRLLLENDTTFWAAGQEYTIFETDGIKFATPICFEDTFGYLSREFVRRGAEVIVNLTNDGWSYSVPAQMQHMAMAVFRATENRRSVIRSTNSGMTTVIDPNGRMQGLLEPFTEDYMVREVPVYTETTTLYTRWGDWAAWAALALAVLALGWGIVRSAIIRLTPGKGSETIMEKGTADG
ncbi:MAG: apolipoprotein N-acyltransferase [Spirochaetes bacterium]|jgi:apolipoprotein N-acyltransferase|nr:apolipoprotein N-acyltransferase [Spirochaetota bacterium]